MTANSNLYGSLNSASVTPRRRVTDAATRMLHWLFALGFVGAYVTADSEHWRNVHIVLGYAMLGLVGIRILWGLLGPKRVRLGSLIARVRGVMPFIDQIKAGQPLWNVSWTGPQNALMAALIALLLIATIPLVLSGYLTNADIAGELMEELHEFLGEFYLVLVLSHLGAIAILSLVRRRNLVNPMLTGFVNDKGPDLVKNNHLGFAIFIAAGTVAWCVYYLNL